MPRARKLARWTAHAALACGLLCLFFAPAACSLYRNDKCYVDNQQFQIAYSLFVESGSVDLVQRQLTELQWRRCKINEVVYRLTKLSEVPEESTPAARQ